jgi:hypothetical protein
MKKLHKKINPLFWLISITLLPILISWCLYFYHTQLHFKSLNHGVLITPAIPAPLFNKNSLAANHKVWRIIAIDKGDCKDNCPALRHTLSQIQTALGKDYRRVELVFLNSDDQDVISMQKLLQLDPRAKIFLQDPLNNLFMYYPDTVNPMGILKDLQQVLKASQIG